SDPRFSWIDNIYEIRDKSQKRSLDAQLLDKLRSNDLTNAWLALPEIIDWQRARDFSYVTPAYGFTVDDISLPTFIESLSSRAETLDVITFKRSKVICLDHNDEILHKWSAYKCLYAEIETASGDIFLLTNGHWYRMNREIVHAVNSWYQHLTIDSNMLPPMIAKERENDYNRRVGRMSQYTLFHSAPITLPATRGPIEFCDLLALQDGSKDLIHVKRYGRSSKLSHLFFQGTNAARLFRISPEFRKALSASVASDPGLAAQLAKEPRRGEYRVVFAIASNARAGLELPLFSKLSLQQALRELDGLGFRAAVARIKVPEEERLLKRKKRRTVRRTF
ncbi:MAG TPA: TIGR04141 family sporadically distributed protein, partial [Thermoanaerobaculia bacterium]|nr:TIGR04141 family sporadically distributed protein [Thermoanaerobaculia bacterium]